MSIRIQFATDFVCPYCYVAEVPLKQALEERTDVVLELLPLELTPISGEPVDTYHDEQRRAKWAKDLLPLCEEIGLEAHFPPKVIPRPYTHLAWQGYHYAVIQGKGEAYAEAIYHAYFTEERDIGDLEILSSIAGTLGLDAQKFRAMLESGEFSDYQDEAVRKTREMGVNGVPAIWIDGRRLMGDFFTKKDFDFYLNCSGDSASGDFGGGFTCGPDGC